MAEPAACWREEGVDPALPGAGIARPTGTGRPPIGSGVERWREAAAQVSRGLVAQARRRDGEVVWPAPLDPHLYGGVCGVAFFLAAWHRVAGDSGSRDLALAAIAPLRLKLRQLAASPQRAAGLRLGVGGLVGLGSFLYTFTRLAGWLEDAELLADAGRCQALLTAERLAADESYDVVSGSAGALLALLALSDVAADAGEVGARQSALASARACADRLLAGRVSWRGRPPAWPGPEGRPPLSGFAHGAAGIAFALLRFAARTGDEACRRAAAAGIDFERSLYLPQEDGWLDPRCDRPVEQSAWCHGTPGIALGRAGGLAVLDDATARAELERTLRATVALPVAPRDHLCCGNAGRVEILHTAALALGRPDLGAAALRLAGEMLGRAEDSGGFLLEVPGDPGGASPSLFFGAAGVGYTLLRLAHPEILPCPLWLG